MAGDSQATLTSPRSTEKFREALSDALIAKQSLEPLIKTHIKCVDDIKIFLQHLLKTLSSPHHINNFNDRYFHMLEALFEFKHPLIKTLATSPCEKDYAIITKLLNCNAFSGYQRYYLLKKLNVKSVDDRVVKMDETSSQNSQPAEQTTKEISLLNKLTRLTKYEAAELYNSFLKNQPEVASAKCDLLRTQAYLDNLEEFDPRNLPLRIKLSNEIKRIKKQIKEVESPSINTAKRLLFLTDNVEFSGLMHALSRDLAENRFQDYPFQVDLIHSSALLRIGESLSLQKGFKDAFNKISKYKKGKIIKAFIHRFFGEQPFVDKREIPPSLVKILNLTLAQEGVSKKKLAELLIHNARYSYKAFSEPPRQLIEIGTGVLGFFTVCSAAPWIVTWAYTNFYGLSLTFAAVPPVLMLIVVSAIGLAAGIGLWAIRFYTRRTKAKHKRHANQRNDECAAYINEAENKQKKIAFQTILKIEKEDPEKANQLKANLREAHKKAVFCSIKDLMDRPPDKVKGRGYINLKGDILKQEQLTNRLLDYTLRTYSPPQYRKHLNDFIDKHVLSVLPKTALDHNRTVNRYFAYVLLKSAFIQLSSNGHKVYKTFGRRLIEFCAFIAGSVAGWGGLHFVALILAVANNNPFTVFGLNPAVFATSLTIAAVSCGYFMWAYFYDLIREKTQYYRNPALQGKNPYLDTLMALEPEEEAQYSATVGYGGQYRTSPAIDPSGQQPEAMAASSGINPQQAQYDVDTKGLATRC